MKTKLSILSSIAIVLLCGVFAASAGAVTVTPNPVSYSLFDANFDPVEPVSLVTDTQTIAGVKVTLYSQV